MKIINAGVTAPKGFKCAGLRAGVKPGKTNKDMAMIVSEVPAKIAGTFTKNIVKAAPVLWGKKIVEEQEADRAVVINTGIANACPRAQGYENVVTEAKEVAKLLDIKPEEVVVGSTGVIGQQLPMDVIKEGIKKLVPELKADRQSEEDASWAILTTDTKPKEAAVEVEIDAKTVTIAGMCKGSGMIHPNMGTMLGFITTDPAIDKALLLELQRELIEDTFNMVSVDGDTSTNDTVFVFGIGRAVNNEITEIGAVKVIDGKISDTFEMLVKPNQKISQKITDITVITNEMVNVKPPIDEVLPKFIEFIGGLRLVAHNIDFDYGFLCENYNRVYKKEFNRKKSCTMKMYRKWYKDQYDENAPCAKLGDVVLELLGNEEYLSYLSNSHRGLNDAEFTQKVYENLI